MTRWKYIGATVLLFIALILNRILIEGKYTTSSSLGVLALILFFVASWRRARFLGYSTGKCISAIIAMFLPLVSFIMVIILICSSKKESVENMDDNDKQTLSKQSTSKFNDRKGKILNFMHSYPMKFWALIFCVISLISLLFFVPYKTSIPATYLKNHHSYETMNGTVNYGTFSSKPNMDKRLKQYTDISYSRLGLQEVIVAVVCAGGFILTTSKRQ